MSNVYISPEYFEVSTDATIENVIARLSAKIASNTCNYREENTLAVAMMTGTLRGLSVAQKPCGINWGHVYDNNVRCYNATK